MEARWMLAWVLLVATLATAAVPTPPVKGPQVPPNPPPPAPPAAPPAAKTIKGLQTATKQPVAPPSQPDRVTPDIEDKKKVEDNVSVHCREAKANFVHAMAQSSKATGCMAGQEGTVACQKHQATAAKLTADVKTACEETAPVEDVANAGDSKESVAAVHTINAELMGRQAEQRAKDAAERIKQELEDLKKTAQERVEDTKITLKAQPKPDAQKSAAAKAALKASEKLELQEKAKENQAVLAGQRAAKELKDQKHAEAVQKELEEQKQMDKNGVLIPRSHLAAAAKIRAEFAHAKRTSEGEADRLKEKIKSLRKDIDLARAEKRRQDRADRLKAINQLKQELVKLTQTTSDEVMQGLAERVVTGVDKWETDAHDMHKKERHARAEARKQARLARRLSESAALTTKNLPLARSSVGHAVDEVSKVAAAFGGPVGQELRAGIELVKKEKVQAVPIVVKTKYQMNPLQLVEHLRSEVARLQDILKRLADGQDVNEGEEDPVHPGDKLGVRLVQRCDPKTHVCHLERKVPLPPPQIPAGHLHPPLAGGDAASKVEIIKAARTAVETALAHTTGDTARLLANMRNSLGYAHESVTKEVVDQAKVKAGVPE